MSKTWIRRQFIEDMAKLSLGMWAMNAMGCMARRGTNGAGSAVANVGTVRVRDLNVIALYSDGTRGPNTGVIRATDIRDGKILLLSHWDGHGHKYTVGAEQYSLIKKGQASRVKTTLALNHDHLVLIDPAHAVSGGQELEIPLEGSTTPTPTPTPSVPLGGGTPPNDDGLYAALTNKDDADLLVAGTRAVREESLEYCLETLEACQRDPRLWKKMVPNVGSGSQMFRSASPLQLDRAQQELSLVLRGNFIDNGGAVQQLLKLKRK